jgi:hypothetical protein
MPQTRWMASPFTSLALSPAGGFPQPLLGTNLALNRARYLVDTIIGLEGTLSDNDVERVTL